MISERGVVYRMERTGPSTAPWALQCMICDGDEDELLTEVSKAAEWSTNRTKMLFTTRNETISVRQRSGMNLLRTERRWSLQSVTELFDKTVSGSPCLKVLVSTVNLFNPFTAVACQISWMKSAHVHACKQYIWRSCNNSTVYTVLFDTSLVLSRAHACGGVMI